MRLVLYTGKGGVGKTTTAAATAVCAAARGVSTLVVSADAAHSLGDVLGQPIDDAAARLAPVPVAERLDALEVDARLAMERHWGRVRDYLVSLFRYQGIDEVVAEELALLPGAEELATLLAVEDLAASGRYQLVVVDCYATWCGPCKTAAPVYAQLSEKFSASSIVFAKVDVDAAKGVAAKLAISAMPTFKVFKGGKEVDSSRGWPGAATLEQMLSKHGAVKEAASSKKD